MDESQSSSLIQKQQAMLQQQMSKLQQEQLSSLFQQQHQSAISRFPSNIDAHLGFRHSLNPNNNNNNNNHIHNNTNNNNNNNNNNSSSIPLLQQQLVNQQKKVQGMRTAAAAAAGGASQPEVQLAYQDAWKVCHPDFTRPFSSLQDACERLLPYHVVADYEAEEDDRILESDTTGQILSRSQQWDNNIAAKVAEFTATFEKQALAFNIISRKRSLGEFRSEERLMIEQALLQEEKQAVYEVKTEIESREKAGREAQLRMAAAMVQARGDAQRGPLRGSAVGSQGSDHEMMSEREHHGAEEMMNGWGNNLGREEREPSEDFLNDEETDNGETIGQHEWREVGEFDLNTR